MVGCGVVCWQQVAILNIKAAGVGLTLTRASTVVFAELAWTPSEVQQAEDRAHRIGQTNCVSVQLLIVKDSIDEVMWDLLQSKLATTGQVLDGQVERLEVREDSFAGIAECCVVNFAKCEVWCDSWQATCQIPVQGPSAACQDAAKGMSATCGHVNACPYQCYLWTCHCISSAA